MASPFQRQALQRKLIYMGLILVLLTVTWGWRYADFKVFGMEVKGVDEQAKQLAIREQSRGEVELSGAVIRLSLTGLRGWATCVLWVSAMDAQKKNQWNELELFARSVAKLQPHYITPWIFQSWNLAYNVSVESDRVSDKYFYISRGIGLLAEGERQNQDNPDMRWSIGFFMQHKIGQSDETNTLRSLSQLSMIPPNERDAGRFQKMNEGRQELNLTEFEDFCKQHPQLVRRLREGIRRERAVENARQFRCERAEEVVRFLADNARVPSLWEDSLPSSPGDWKKKQDKERPLADRFPVLPPRHSAKPNQQAPDGNALTTASQLNDADDAYQVAAAWYSYAQEPLPAPSDLPGENEPIVDRVHQRISSHMATVIFRDYPAQAQRFTAERLQAEGWFDQSGWDIPDWFREQGDKFSNGEPANIGGGHAWARDAWDKTHRQWSDFGNANHLHFSDPAAQLNMEERAKRFTEKFSLADGSSPVLREENLDAETRGDYFAWKFMKAWRYATHVTNFDHHYNRTLVEAKEETIEARKLFYEAEALHLKNKDPRALQKYQDPHALKAWREKVLLGNKEFRRDTFIQEQTFEIQLKYIDLYIEQSGKDFKAEVARLVLLPAMNPAGVGICPAGLTDWVAPILQKNQGNPLLGGPFDGRDNEGFPLVDAQTRTTVLRRLYPALFTASSSSSGPASAATATKR